MHRQLAELVTEFGDEVLTIWLDGGGVSRALLAPPPRSACKRAAMPWGIQPQEKKELVARLTTPWLMRCVCVCVCVCAWPAQTPSAERWRTHDTYKVSEREPA